MNGLMTSVVCLLPYFDKTGLLLKATLNRMQCQALKNLELEFRGLLLVLIVTPILSLLIMSTVCVLRLVNC